MLRVYYEAPMNKIDRSKLKVRNYKQGQSIMVAIVFFLVIGMSISLGMSTPVLKGSRLVKEQSQSLQSLVTTEALEEDVSYRIKHGMHYSATETMSLNGTAATTTVTNNVTTGRIEIRSTGKNNRATRKKYQELIRGDNVTFNYGAQAGNGGIRLTNSSSIYGNVYANGGATGTSDNLIRGTVVSAGPGGWVEGVHATSSVYAHTIKNSTIDLNAYYQTITGSTVAGTSYPGSEDRPPEEFPISDETLDEWEQSAEAGGVHSAPCPWVITSAQTIGPIKVNCDLTIKTHDTVTIAGMVWVNGDISFETGPTIALDPSLGASSIAMIADNPSNRSTASTIKIKNSTTFQDSGTDGSRMMLVSRNTSAEDGGSTIGIDLQQSASGAILLYSNHGKISVAQSSQLKEVTGYSIVLSNTATLTYESGAASELFDTGPGGSWNIYDWKETE